MKPKWKKFGIFLVGVARDNKPLNQGHKTTKIS
jgi:hypothetical protein